MRQFHNPLPDPEQAGLKWKPYEEAREKITRIEERSREAGMKAKALEQRIREEERADVRKLAQSILAGDADPAAPVEELDSLGTELREVRRERQALDEALPEAEEELRRTAWEHQEEWTSQADEALAKAIEEERSAYARAQEIAQKARERRLYFEALGD
jgi:chromosome segregation ATPase